jgi:type IV pilus assembly protein PilF
MYYARGDYQRARFYSGRVLKGRKGTADDLWTAIRTERKLSDRATENSLVTQLRRNYPASRELAAYLRGAFDE